MKALLILILIYSLCVSPGCTGLKQAWLKANENWALSGESGANPAKWEIRRKIAERTRE